MAENQADEMQVVTAEDMRRAAIEKWGYAAARLRADAAIILAIAAVIELGLVREDPTWRASKIHEAVDKASNLL